MVLPENTGDAPNYQSVQQLLAAFYGGAFVTRPVDTDFTIGTVAVALTSTEPGQRISVLLSNTGSTNLYISFNSAVVSPNGVLLLPGGSFKLHWYYDGDLVSRVLYGAGSAAGGTLHLLESKLAGG